MRPDDALARLPVPARRLAYRTAHAMLRFWWIARPPQGGGVKCLLRRDGRVLFVRHTYGDRRSWELPGGGIGRGETPAQAAVREAREELGVIADWRELATIHAGRGRRSKTLTLFVADLPAPGGSGPAGRDRTSPTRLAIDEGEIAAVRWAPLEDPPQPLSPLAAFIVGRVRRG